MFITLYNIICKIFDSLDVVFLLISSYTALSADLFMKLLLQVRFLILLVLWIEQVNITSNFIYNIL